MTPAAPATLLLAHGAGAAMDSPFMAAIAGGLAQRGWRVVHFKFAYMARMPVLQEAYRQQVRREKSEQPGRALFIGGKSMGGRVPTLILQGERDSFGKREEVATYSLSPQLQLGWIPSGDHSFKPTRSSGLSEAGNWATAVALADRFLREQQPMAINGS